MATKAIVIRIVVLQVLLLLICSTSFCQQDAATYGNYAAGLFAKGDHDQALTYYSYSVKVDANYWQGWLGIGRCYEGKGDKANAKKYYEYSLSLSPGNQEISDALAALDGRGGAGATADASADEETAVAEEPAARETSVQGLRSREKHKLTICFSFLTPVILGGDIGYNINYKMNAGLGIGWIYYGMTFEPRFKYFFSEHEHSTYIGFGIGIIRAGEEDHRFYVYRDWMDDVVYERTYDEKETYSVIFPHFKIGLSRQGYGGLLFEFEFDIGYAKASHKDVDIYSYYYPDTGETEVRTDTDEDGGGYPIVWIGMRIGFCI